MTVGREDAGDGQHLFVCILVQGKLQLGRLQLGLGGLHSDPDRHQIVAQLGNGGVDGGGRRAAVGNACDRGVADLGDPVSSLFIDHLKAMDREHLARCDLVQLVPVRFIQPHQPARGPVLHIRFPSASAVQGDLAGEGPFRDSRT